jgi:hypothetical protein
MDWHSLPQLRTQQAVGHNVMRGHVTTSLSLHLIFSPSLLGFIRTKMGYSKNNVSEHRETYKAQS